MRCLLLLALAAALLSQRVVAQSQEEDAVAAATAALESEETQVPETEEEEEDENGVPRRPSAAQEGLPPREPSPEERAMEARYMQHLLRRTTPPCRKELQDAIAARSQDNLSAPCKEELATLQESFKRRMQAEANGGSGAESEGDGAPAPRAKATPRVRVRKESTAPPFFSSLFAWPVFDETRRIGATVLFVCLILLGGPVMYAYLTAPPAAPRKAAPAASPRAAAAAAAKKRAE